MDRKKGGQRGGQNRAGNKPQFKNKVWTKNSQNSRDFSSKKTKPGGARARGQPDVNPQSERDKAIIRQYQKSLKKNPTNPSNPKELVQLDKFASMDKNLPTDPEVSGHQKSKKKPSKFAVAKESYKINIKMKKQAQIEQKKRSIEVKEAQIRRKKERKEKFKIFNQKTPKGQPLMRGRIEYLLKKIQST